MPSFQEMFEKSAGKPIIYQRKKLRKLDDFPTKGVKILRLVFEGCNAEWRQGVALRFDHKVRVNGTIIRRGIVLWQDTAPQTVDLEVIGKVSTIKVKNVWDIGDGETHSWHNGAAMIVEPLPNGRRYRCNDGLDDDDFDDIVFQLERIS